MAGQLDVPGRVLPGRKGGVRGVLQWEELEHLEGGVEEGSAGGRGVVHGADGGDVQVHLERGEDLCHN